MERVMDLVEVIARVREDVNGISSLGTCSRLISTNNKDAKYEENGI